MNKRIMTVYFSAGGVTAKRAKELAKAADTALYEIQPESPYTREDLDWKNKKSRSSMEMQDSAARPALAGQKADLTEYDEILIGFPIWWGIAPRLVQTFLEQNSFAGKTVRLFATSGGSTLDYCEGFMKTTYPDLNWAPGKMLNSTSAVRDLAGMILNA